MRNVRCIRLTGGWLVAACALLLCSLVPADAGNSIHEVKQAEDGTHVHLTGKVVAARLWGNRFYIVEPNRSCGIGVLHSLAVSPGQIVTVEGYKTTLHGESYIGAPAISVSGSTAAPKPVGMSSASFHSGPSTAGLPVKVWGVVTSGLTSDSLGDFFTISDGGPNAINVYVGNTGAQPPAVGIMVTVTGVSGVNDSVPVVLLGSAQDIRTYIEPVDPTPTPGWLWSATGIARTPLDLSAVAAACADGADIVEVPVQDVWHAFYPSAVATSGGPYGNGALLQQIIAYAHSLGVKVVGAMPACRDASCLTAQPGWRQRPTDSTIWLTRPADQVTGCLISPYGEYLIDEIAELAGVVGLDGVSLSGYSNNHAFCYCDYCKSAYQAETGSPIPAAVNYDSANFRRYLAWHDAQIVEHMNELRLRVRTANRGFGILGWSSNAGEYAHYQASPHIMPTALNSLFDCPMQRVWYDEANVGLSVVPDFGLRFMNALARGRPWIAEADYTTRSADATIGVAGSSLPEAEITFRMLSAIAAGAKTSFGSLDKQHLRASLFALAADRKTWTYRAEPMKWAAMVVSETTRQFYGRGDAVNRYMQSCFGMFRALQEQHLPVDILTDAELEAGETAGYSVLVLPNTACLSVTALAAVRNFVAAGGGLVATGAASLYDENGAQLAEFALADLFRASRSGSPVSVEYRATVLGTVYARNREALQGLLSPYGHITSFVGQVYPVSVAAGGETMATVCSDYSCSASHPIYINNANPGGGRIAYFPAGLDAAYYRYSYPYEGVLLYDALMWAASSPPEISVAGPKSLQATFFTQNNGKRLVVHLLNASNSRGGRAHPAGDTPARDETPPLYDIEVWFHTTAPASATLQPGNTLLSVEHIDGRARVIVPELGQHSMVVADLP